MLKNTHLYQEIYEQPAVIKQVFANEQATLQALANELRQRDITHVVIAARGTSDNAGRYAKYVLGAKNGITVTLATPSLFSIYKQPPRFGNALVLGISQSGQSPDIVSVLAEARKQGTLTAAITNFADSPLAAEADFMIGLNAGIEKAVAATKTYTSELAAIAMLSALLADDEAMSAELAQIPNAVADTLALDDTIAALVPRYRYVDRSVVIGRGYNYATAFELALKLKELTYTTVEPYSSADFQHGPFALIEYGFPVVTIAPSGIILPELQSFIGKLRKAGAEVIAVSDDEATLAMAQKQIKLPTAVPEWLSPLTAIVAGQLFAMHAADTRGYDIDQPRGLNKVTETH